MRSLTPAVRAVLVDIRTSPRTALRMEPTSVRLACMAGLACRGRDGPALTALGAFALRTGSVPSEPEEVSALTEILLQGPSGADPEAVGSGTAVMRMAEMGLISRGRDGRWRECERK